LILLLAAFATPAYSSDNYFTEQYLNAGGGLYEERLKDKTEIKTLIDEPWLCVDKYLEDSERFNNLYIGNDIKKETEPNGFYWSGFRLSISRYQDQVVHRDMPSYKEQQDIKDIIKSVPFLFSEDNRRDTLETLGGILAPQLRLELEF